MNKAHFSDHRLTINLTEAEHLQLAELARRAHTSLSQLGKLAISHLLLKSDEMLPLLPKADLDSAPLPPWRGTICGRGQSF